MSDRRRWWERSVPYPWVMRLGAALALTLGVVLNPWILTAKQCAQWVACIELALGVVVLTWEVVFARRREEQDPFQSAVHEGNTTRPGVFAWLLLGWIGLLWVVMYRQRWTDPSLFHDDFDHIALAGDWSTTWRHLLTPYNEHLIVPTRLTTFVCRWWAPDDFTLPFVMAWSTIPLFSTALVLVFLLARVEWKSDFAGLLAACLFALTTTYREVVWWYSASVQWLVTLILLLGSLLLVACPGRPVSWGRVSCAGALAFVAPFGNSLGVVVGPLTTVWMFFRTAAGRWRRLKALVPTLAACAGFLVCHPFLAVLIDSSEYSDTGGRGALQILDAPEGVRYGVRLLVDVLLLRNLGIVVSGTGGFPYQLVAFPVLVVSVVFLMRRYPATWRLTPMLLMIIVPYALVLPFRTWVGYETILGWTRYQVLPQLGAALFAVGALHGFAHAKYFAGGRMSARQAILVLAASLALTGIHWKQVKWRNFSRSREPHKPAPVHVPMRGEV